MGKDTGVIRVIGSIDEAAFKDFSEKLSELEKQSWLKPITLEIHSEGGTAYDALAFAGRMRTSKCKFNVKVYGYAASAAVLILAYGDYRCMAREAWVMVHEDSGKIQKIEGNIVEMEQQAEQRLSEIKQYRRMENQWAELLAARTNTTAALWSELHKQTTYLSAAECKTLGLIDEVV